MEELLNQILSNPLLFGIVAGDAMALVDKIRNVKWLGDYIQKHIDDIPKNFVVKSLSKFEKYGLLDDSLREKIEKMTVEDWNKIFEDVINSLRDDETEIKAFLNKNLILTYINQNISKAGLLLISRAMRDLPTEDLLALCQVERGLFTSTYNKATGPYFEILKPYGLITQEIQSDTWHGKIYFQYSLSSLGWDFYNFILKPIGSEKLKPFLPKKALTQTTPESVDDATKLALQRPDEWLTILRSNH